MIFLNPERFYIKARHFFHFDTPDQNVLGIKSTRARNVIVQQCYSNVESTNSSVVKVFVLAIAILKMSFKPAR